MNMKKIEISDIMSIEEYERVRPDFRERLFAIKAARRVSVGPYFTFLFENRDTMHYQIQEMIRVENIKNAEGVAHEVKTYNNLLPDQFEFTATLLIEISDENARNFKLKELLGVQDHVFLVLEDGARIPATFDEEQYNEVKVSSVQYIRFSLGPENAESFLKSEKAELEVTHPAYGYRQTLSRDQHQALVEDLRQSMPA